MSGLFDYFLAPQQPPPQSALGLFSGLAGIAGRALSGPPRQPWEDAASLEDSRYRAGATAQYGRALSQGQQGNINDYVKVGQGADARNAFIRDRMAGGLQLQEAIDAWNSSGGSGA